MMNHTTMADMVRHFQSTFGLPVDHELRIGAVDLEHIGLREALHAEEYREVVQAAQLLATGLYQKRGSEFLAKAKADYLKELCDLIYVLLGTAVTFGFKVDPAFVRVHDRNMLKVRDENADPMKPKKVKKGSNYVAPDLTDLVAV